MKFYQKVGFTGGTNMSDWKVLAGNCACRTRKSKDLPIDFLPSQVPGLCPDCFIKDNPSKQTINERLSTLTNEEKELLFRNFLGAHLGNEGAQTTRYKMAKFGYKLSRGKRIPILEIYRFSWKDNPDPEVLRRLLYDDIPNAKHALRRNSKDWGDIQLVPVLVCKKVPSRENSAWKNTVDVVSKWPQNNIKVHLYIFNEVFFKKVLYLRSRKNYTKKK